MKKTTLFLALAALIAVSCNKDDVPTSGSDEDMADYTIIFWGMSGTNDYGVAADLITVAENYLLGRTGENVQIAGLVKTSINLAYPDAADFDKTYYFESGDMTGKTLNWNDVDKSDAVDLYENAFRLLNATTYSDINYPLNSADSLAAFIQMTAERHPAHNYVLMLLGHGGGFSPAEETSLTKACLYDNYRNGDYLTANTVVSAVQKSGVKVQTIFTQCCLMATLENIAAYSQVFDYGIMAAEITYSYYFPEYLVKLSAAGNDEDKMQAASRGLVDYYISTLADDPTAYTTHGFYNLKKAPELLSAVADLAAWYSGNFPALQDNIEDAVSKTIFCDNLLGTDSEALRKEREFIQAILYGDDLSELVGEMTFEEFMMEMARKMSDLLDNSISYGFPFAHLLSTTADEIESSSLKTNFKSLTDKYMQVLKDMAYIKANPVPSGAGSDYEYLYCSPTVNIFALNEKYFIPFGGRNFEESYNRFQEALKNEDVDAAGEAMEEIFGGSPFANYVTLDQALANYTSSVFDRQVKWSDFLKQLEMNPSVIYNPDRMQINEKVYGMK